MAAPLAPVPRHVNSIGFTNHWKMAFNDPNTLLGPDADNQPRTYTPNNLEKLGDMLTWHITKFPQFVKNTFHNPKVCTIALTIAALSLVHLVFYPTSAIHFIKASVIFIADNLSPEAVKLVAYSATQLYVLGFGIRSFARFSNTDLMIKWKQNAVQG